jgi:hypothetical protein
VLGQHQLGAKAELKVARDERHTLLHQRSGLLGAIKPCAGKRRLFHINLTKEKGGGRGMRYLLRS